MSRDVDATDRSGCRFCAIETRAEWQLVDIANGWKRLNQPLYAGAVTTAADSRTADRRVEFSRRWTRILHAQPDSAGPSVDSAP